MIKAVSLIFILLAFAGCAKNIDRDAVRDGDREDVLLKQSWLGTGEERNVYLAKTTIVETSNSPGGFSFLGFQGDVKIGYFDFTQQKLQFKSLAGLKEGSESVQIKNPVLLTWDVAHLDFTLDETDGQTTNREIFDNFKTWEKRKYFRINWPLSPNSSNVANMLPSASFAQFSCWDVISQERVPGSMKIEDDHIGFKLQVVYQRKPACGNAVQWSSGDFNFTTTYMFSFRKAEPSDYEPKFYREEQDPARYKFGHFQTVRREIDSSDGTPVNRFMENRWAEKTHNFYFIKGYPEKYKWIWDHKLPHSVFGQTNALLKSAGSKLRFEIYDHNYNPETGKNDGPEREFGDLRYSFINFIEDLEPGGTPLGYGPSDTHPWTGEIIAANSMVWTGLLDWFVRRAQDTVDFSSGTNGSAENEGQNSNSNSAQAETNPDANSSLYKEIFRVLGVNSFADFEKDWDHSQGVGQLFREMAQETRYVFPGWNSYTKTFDIFAPSEFRMDRHPGRIDGSRQGSVGQIATVLNEMQKVLSKDHDLDTDRLLGAEDSPPDIGETPVFFGPYGQFQLGDTESGPSRARLRSRLQDVHLAMKGWLDDTQLNSSFFDSHDHNSGDAFGNLLHNHALREGAKISLNQEGHCIIDMDEFAGGLAGFLKGNPINLSDEKTRQDFINTVLYRVSIHEFGHNLNLRHNFYGSVDQSQFNLHKRENSWSNNDKVLTADGQVIEGKRKQVSSSVMDYLRIEDEINTPWAWEDYDVAAILNSYAPEGSKKNAATNDEELFLFCTDEHTRTSALCNRHDLGTTPSQIMMSQIRAYEEGYLSRNFRYGRDFWNSSGYASRVLNTMLSMKEFLPMWRSAFAPDLLIQKLEQMGVPNPNDQKALVEEMNREMLKVMRLSLAFYQGVIQQSDGTRGFRSDYDPTTGALTRIGTFFDKLFATHMMANDFPIFYNPNRVLNYNSYLTYSTMPELADMAAQMWRNLLTDRNVAMEPWFIGFARMLYAQNASNFGNRARASVLDLIKVVKVDDAEELLRDYGVEFDPNDNTQIKRVRLETSVTGAFQKGQEVVIAYVDDAYYLAPASESEVAYTLFQRAFDRVGRPDADDESVVQFRFDIVELHWLYNQAKGKLSL